MDLDQLDAEQRGPMGVLVDGVRVELPAAADLAWKVTALALTEPMYFLRAVWPSGRRIDHWKVEQLQQAWVKHNGLVSYDQLRRLVYMLEKYYDGIEFDLRTKVGVDLGQMWRDRRWRELLNFIDQLPSDSQMNRLLSQDREYMERVLSDQRSRSDNAPSMADWSQTNRMLADLIDAVNALTAVTKGIAGQKKNDFRPYPRPKTAADSLRYEQDRRNHEEMNAILLRGRNSRTSTIAGEPPDKSE